MSKATSINHHCSLSERETAWFYSVNVLKFPVHVLKFPFFTSSELKISYRTIEPSQQMDNLSTCHKFL